MKEIGGYFGLEQLPSNEYYKKLIPLNSGRNALLYILKVKKINKLYIPYYLCDEVSDILVRNDYDFEYYRIDVDFTPILSKTLDNDEFLYIVNYYGQLSNDKLLFFKQLYNQIIIDNTHSFYQNPIDGIDTIYNCRKFFGVPDGSYLSTDLKLNRNLDIDVSNGRMTHILGRYEGEASQYYEDFKYNDIILRTEPLKYMSKLTHNILGAIDYERVRKVRNENYAYLNSKLAIYNKIKLETPDGAFAYPFYVKNGIEVRKELANKKIYIPMLWPNVLTNTPEGSIEYDYVANILPLPCDQRYSFEDMDCVVEELKKYV